jgi:nucleoside-diphosphate-sugar epimerase
MHALIVGCGYLGKRIATRLQAEGHAVSAVTRSADRAAEWSRIGWKPIVADVADPATLRGLPAVDAVFYAVGYDSSGGRSKRDVYVNGLSNVLTAMTGRMGAMVYISSTSVYGQTDGETVDETSTCEPSTESGRICLEAERLLTDWARQSSPQTRAMILRLAGIYGPGRLLARADALTSRKPLPGRGDAWLNLIHVDDAARLAIQAALVGSGGAIYLGSDELPVRRCEFYSCLAELVEAPVPDFDESDGAGTRTLGLNKRCYGRRTRLALKTSLRFPSYREGLGDAVRAM